ncbi:MAG TPA: hypothetical protein VMB78_11860, partial [Dissulfurispiraceae bacterium]|nr:hypothetical protein [Dissulfurispiraceae bacterium]
MRTGRIISLAVICIVAMALVPFTVYGADKLLVKDASSNTVFKVQDVGTTNIVADGTVNNPKLIVDGAADSQTV